MKPGAGFVVLVSSVLLSASFVGWGLRTPELDRVWKIVGQLELGKQRRMSRAERQLFAETLQRYQKFAEGLLDEANIGIISKHRDGLIDHGFAYLVRRGPKPRYDLVVEATDVRARDGMKVEVRTQTQRTTGTVGVGAPFVWSLPDDGPFPQLIEVHVDTRGRPAIVIRAKERG